MIRNHRERMQRAHALGTVQGFVFEKLKTLDKKCEKYESLRWVIGQLQRIKDEIAPGYSNNCVKAAKERKGLSG